MLGKVTESPAGKIGIIVVAVIAVVVAIFTGVRFATGGGPQYADPQEVKSDAQKQIDIVKNNPNIPPDVKAGIIAHEEGLLSGRAPGGAGRAGAGPAAKGP